jgi:hypothetical protein
MKAILGCLCRDITHGTVDDLDIGRIGKGSVMRFGVQARCTYKILILIDNPSRDSWSTFLPVVAIG